MYGPISTGFGKMVPGFVLFVTNSNVTWKFKKFVNNLQKKTESFFISIKTKYIQKLFLEKGSFQINTYDQ